MAERSVPAARQAKEAREAAIVRHLPHSIRTHRTMAGDAVRNELLHQALARRVGPATRVLDVGAGVGTWAIVAALLGAKRVVAVEVDASLIPFIHRHALENGVADRIEIVHGDVERTRIRGRFDVIVSELFGHDAIGERVLRTFESIRGRHLAPGGVVIPQAIEVVAAPVHDPDAHLVPGGLDISLEFLRTSSLHYPLALPLAERLRLQRLAAPATLLAVDLRSTSEAPSFAGLRATWAVDDLGALDGVAVFNRHVFDDGVEMDSDLSASWGSTYYPCEAPGSGPGRIGFEVTMDAAASAWSVEVDGRRAGYGPELNRMRWHLADGRAPRRTVRAPRPER